MDIHLACAAKVFEDLSIGATGSTGNEHIRETCTKTISLNHDRGHLDLGMRLRCDCCYERIKLSFKLYVLPSSTYVCSFHISRFIPPMVSF